MINLFLENFYYFATILTASYCFAFIFFLSGRFQYSLTSRRFAVFLMSVFAWSVKDSLVSAVGPYLSAEQFLRLTVISAALFFTVPPAAFAVFVSIYNASVSSRHQFRHLRITQTILIVVLLVNYVLGLFLPAYLYRDIVIAGNAYTFTPGPGIYAFLVVTILFCIIPGYLLLVISRLKFRSEAFMFGAGTQISMSIVLCTNFFPGLLGITQLPRLGCVSMGIFCGFAFYGISKYGHAFSITEVLEEREKLRKIGQSLRYLLQTFDEKAAFRNIADCAREISESAFSLIVFGKSNEHLKIQTVSRDTSAPFAPAFLQEGNELTIRPNSRMNELVVSNKALACNSIHDLFPDQISNESANEFSTSAHIRQILCYPIALDNEVRGAVLLLKRHPSINIDLFDLFSVQCVLVMKFSTQIRELEEKRMLQEQLHQAHKMEAIGQLAGGVAHDFNNMLSGIIGYANILRRKYGSTDPKAGKYAEAIIGASKRAADLTNQLLAFARKGTFQMKHLDTHVIIKEVVLLLERTIDKRIRIWQNLLADKPFIAGDPAQIQNALLNLALNARDAMPEGGDLVFETRNVFYDKPSETDSSQQQFPTEHLLISINDSGFGMDSETKSHLFEPFFTTKELGKGTGLGLASVYGTVREHNGQIEINSLPCKGTTVRIYIPLTKQNAGEHDDLSEKETIQGSGTVLVIDDEQIVRDVACEMLEDLGYVVHSCRDGVEGIEWYQEHYSEIDVVLLDLIMPNMDGYRCFEELRKINAEVKVVISTGYNIKQSSGLMIQKAAAGFIKKPYEAGALSHAIASALGLIKEASI